MLSFSTRTTRGKPLKIQQGGKIHENINASRDWLHLQIRETQTHGRLAHKKARALADMYSKCDSYKGTKSSWWASLSTILLCCSLLLCCRIDAQIREPIHDRSHNARTLFGCYWSECTNCRIFPRENLQTSPCMCVLIGIKSKTLIYIYI